MRDPSVIRYDMTGPIGRVYALHFRIGCEEFTDVSVNRSTDEAFSFLIFFVVSSHSNLEAQKMLFVTRDESRNFYHSWQNLLLFDPKVRMHAHLAYICG